MQPESPTLPNVVSMPPAPTADPMNSNPPLPKIIALGVALFVVLLLSSSATYLVQPGTRGIKVTLGKTDDQFLPEGFGFKSPFITRIEHVNVQQRTEAVKADCFSSDLQQVIVDLRVLYRVPEQSVVSIYKQFSGDPFDSLIAPRVQEALKEATAMMTAVQIVRNREEVKQKVIAAAKQKIGTILTVEDIVIRNIDLSKELEKAIEAKMVAEQEAAQAKFTQAQTQIEAETAVIRAKGEAEAIHVRGEALKANPTLIKLQIVEKWNGRSPLVVPAQAGQEASTLLLPIGTTSQP